MLSVLRRLQVDDWKRGIALVILYTYAYQLVAWPLLTWAASIGAAVCGCTWPAPPVIPWEQLTVGTGTLATVGGIEAWRDGARHKREEAG